MLQISPKNNVWEKMYCYDLVLHVPRLNPHITLTGDYVWNLNQKTNFNHLRPLRDKSSIKKR